MEYTSSQITFGKINIDPEHNEMTDFNNFDIKSIPSLLLYLPNNKNQPIIYKGKYNKGEVTNFITNYIQNKHSEL